MYLSFVITCFGFEDHYAVGNGSDEEAHSGFDEDDLDSGHEMSESEDEEDGDEEVMVLDPSRSNQFSSSELIGEVTSKKKKKKPQHVSALKKADEARRAELRTIFFEEKEHAQRLANDLAELEGFIPLGASSDKDTSSKQMIVMSDSVDDLAQEGMDEDAKSSSDEDEEFDDDDEFDDNDEFDDDDEETEEEEEMNVDEDHSLQEVNSSSSSRPSSLSTRKVSSKLQRAPCLHLSV